ncbi:MAG: VWA domain-containing protein, partial [Cyclobacteriaceae bacterium]
MQHLELKFDYSPWYILLCLMIGALFAFVLYQKKGPWSNQINYMLATFRFLLVSLLAFLLIGPFLKLIKNRIERPTYVFAVDNSTSIATVNDSARLQEILQSLNAISNKLQEEDYNTEIRLLDGTEPSFDSVKFTGQSTDLAQQLEDIQNNYEG